MVAQSRRAVRTREGDSRVEAVGHQLTAPQGQLSQSLHPTRFCPPSSLPSLCPMTVFGDCHPRGLASGNCSWGCLSAREENPSTPEPGRLALARRCRVWWLPLPRHPNPGSTLPLLPVINRPNNMFSWQNGHFVGRYVRVSLPSAHCVGSVPFLGQDLLWSQFSALSWVPRDVHFPCVGSSVA